MNRHINIPVLKATVFVAVAFVVVSCGGKLKATGELNSADSPVQIVSDMEIVQTDKGRLQLRVVTPRMERYQNDSLEWQLFPVGFTAYFYDESGKLETEIKGENAKHTKPLKGSASEVWAAYNNVVVSNLINKQIMETDTLYWDQDREKLYTDSYVRITDPKGLMQGYGMESDQRARRSVLHRVFNNYAIIDNDSEAEPVDSVNFIGPFPKK